MCVTLASRKISRLREDNAPPCDVMLHAESYGKRVTSHYPEICDGLDRRRVDKELHSAAGPDMDVRDEVR